MSDAPDTSARPATRAEWEQQPDDPDPERDLGYEIVELRSVEARSGGEQHLLFLPEDEEMLRSEAFIVADPDTVLQLEDHV